MEVLTRNSRLVTKIYFPREVFPLANVLGALVDFGIALSVFMSFRNNACYARWWEGRRLWGELIIACRSIARQTSTLEDHDRRFLLHGLCGFTAGLAARLRGQDEREAIEPWSDIGAAPHNPNPTNVVLEQIGAVNL